MSTGERTTPSTTPAAAAMAESREQTSVDGAERAMTRESGEGSLYAIAPSVIRAVEGRPYERKPHDPLYRPLRIFALDPAASKLEGSVTTVNVPYEPLEKTFRGALFEVDASDGGNGQQYQHLDLDDHKLLLEDGRAPSPFDPLFHQQMVYAVASLVYAAFKAALGRDIAWGFTSNNGDQRLRLVPYGMVEENAYYDEDAGEIRFGYFAAAGPVHGRNLPKGVVFTSLSHDIVAHETTHALLDGLREHFMLPTGPDVLGFHEGFADIVAIFQRFSYEQVVRAALAQARGDLGQATTLTTLAAQFGQTLGELHGLRTATHEGKPKLYIDNINEEHDLGNVLVSAVFDAFLTVYRRKTQRYLRLASNGTGTMPPGDLPVELQSILAEQACKLAAQFQAICIRAIDYCPPVDIELGEYLRALITADRELVPDDRWSFREALIDGFRSRTIYPPGVNFLSEDALLWCAPTKAVARIKPLTFAELKFEGDPCRPASAHELRRQAGALGRVVTAPENLEVFGLAAEGHKRLNGDKVSLPCVHSIRSSRRIGPNGQVVFDLIAEVTQTRAVREKRKTAFDFIGGATIVIGPDGAIRYVISKSVLNEQRLKRQRKFLASDRGRELWAEEKDAWVPAKRTFRRLHERRKTSAKK